MHPLAYFTLFSYFDQSCVYNSGVEADHGLLFSTLFNKMWKLYHAQTKGTQHSTGEMITTKNGIYILTIKGWKQNKSMQWETNVLNRVKSKTFLRKHVLNEFLFSHVYACVIIFIM